MKERPTFLTLLPNKESTPVCNFRQLACQLSRACDDKLLSCTNPRVARARVDEQRICRCWCSDADISYVRDGIVGDVDGCLTFELGIF